MADELEGRARSNARLLTTMAGALSVQLAEDDQRLQYINKVQLPTVENELQKSDYFIHSLQSFGGWLKSLFWRPRLQKIPDIPSIAPAALPVDAPGEENDLLRECTAATKAIEANLRAIVSQEREAAATVARMARLEGKAAAANAALKKL